MSLAMQAPLEIGFCVTDLQKSLVFWRDALGMTFISEILTPERAAVESGFADSGYTVVRLQLPTGERIKLFSLSNVDGVTDACRKPLSRVGLAFVTLIVKSLPEAVTMLSHAGFPSRLPPYELRAGVFVALVDDPDGNIVELVQYSDVDAYRAARTNPNPLITMQE